MKNDSLFDEVVEALRCLPGVGPKSAQRMLLYLLERDRGGGRHLAGMLSDAMDRIGNCSRCRNLSEQAECSICADRSRDPSLLCVVETPADVIALEQSAAYRGYYFVLMGTLSPIDGRGPEEIGIEQLVRRCDDSVGELILAVSSTVEGEATMHYITEALKQTPLAISRIAQGIPMGGELEFVDGGTLSRALEGRKQLQQET